MMEARRRALLKALPPPDPKLLCFTALQDNSSVQWTSINGAETSVHIDYSYDGYNWNTWVDGTGGSSNMPLTRGEKIYLKGSNGALNSGGISWNKYHKFVMTGTIDASGDIMSLCGYKSFMETCNFAYLFSGCTALRNPPYCSATAVSNSCCNHMFSGCTNLEKVMSMHTTSARTGYQSYYVYMYENCRSLTEADVDLYVSHDGYNGMFNGCSSLSKIILRRPSSWGDIITAEWVKGVAENGTFVCKQALPDERGTTRIPVGWEKVNL